MSARASRPRLAALIVAAALAAGAVLVAAPADAAPLHVASAATSQTKTLRAATPTVTGHVKVGGILAAHHGTWTSGTRFSYQWYVSHKPVHGATKRTFTVPASARRHAVSVKVTGKRSGYATRSKTSRSTVPVAAAPAPVTSSKPSKPGKPSQPAVSGPAPSRSVNCDDFSTWSQAQTWFKHYYPQYGDIAGLDGDGNGVACQSLPGAP